MVRVRLEALKTSYMTFIAIEQPSQMATDAGKQHANVHASYTSALPPPILPARLSIA